MLKKLLPAAALAVAMMFSAGACAGPRYAGGVSARFGPPPPPRYGPVGHPPARGYVWTDGYWNRGRSGWQWMSGSWRRPPRGRSNWTPGRWEPWRGDYRFHRGHWR